MSTGQWKSKPLPWSEALLQHIAHAHGIKRDKDFTGSTNLSLFKYTHVHAYASKIFQCTVKQDHTLYFCNRESQTLHAYL